MASIILFYYLFYLLWTTTTTTTTERRKRLKGSLSKQIDSPIINSFILSARPITINPIIFRSFAPRCSQEVIIYQWPVLKKIFDKVDQLVFFFFPLILRTNVQKKKKKNQSFNFRFNARHPLVEKKFYWYFHRGNNWKVKSKNFFRNFLNFS